MKFDSHLFGLNAKWYVLGGIILALCAALAHLARWHWSFDLLSHFLIQYAFFGFVFFVIFVLLKLPLLGVLMLMLSVFAYYETRLPLTHPWQFTPPPRIETERNLLRVVQYNKHYDNKNYTAIAQWLNNASEPVDIAFLLEVEPEDARALRSLTSGRYPYTQPAEGLGPDFSLILSRHPFLSMDVKKIAPSIIPTRGTRFEIQPEGFSRPVAFYTFHTRVPIAARGQAQRNAEIAGMAEWIAQDRSTDKILAGDFNITPYSPYFYELKEKSGLQYQSYGVFPPATWVSYFVLPVLKIPIDHMLFGKGLDLLEIKAGPSFGSDHQALIGVFRPSSP
ncbi:MAG: endonuclease/exonuclease/phosphatase family protein [Rhodospirillales bacterium]|nr:endonuclease/exonuclease/phosphatase family protein [Alphaproteobacteria bacterium]MCB9976240.1 endonuclease/exonuclease/phosphatase family protein [Rhodospirillales bacterium]